MPQNAVPTKVAAVKEYGAEARFAPSMETVFAAMDEYRDAHGLHYVHPFGDPDIIAGQGTVGLEIMEDSPDVDTIAVCVGGGGLLAGIAVAAKALKAWGSDCRRRAGGSAQSSPAVWWPDTR